jgi:hypothetical protein
MPNDIIALIVNVLFYLIIAALAFVSLLGIYIFIKYGRSPVITGFISLAYSGVFILLLTSAFFTLLNIF